MRSVRISLIACVVAVLVAVPASADDLFPPAWRGSDRTVRAEWDSWGGTWNSPLWPDSWSCNPAGIFAPFTPYAWAKLQFFCRYEETEIGGFGVAPPDDDRLASGRHLVAEGRESCSSSCVGRHRGHHGLQKTCTWIMYMS